jgi:hypothetical protein
MFELQTIPAPAGLAPLGSSVELRELSYGAVRRAMAEGEGRRASEALLAASLHVDGAPLTLDTLDALPGRFSSAIGQALGQTLALHGMGAASEDDAANDAAGGPAQGEA